MAGTRVVAAGPGSALPLTAPPLRAFRSRATGMTGFPVSRTGRAAPS
jgi:hypothetical protein